MQRFDIVDSFLCSYTIDSAGDTLISDSLAYSNASDWANTINFDSSNDGFQVRCPRCDRDMRKEPKFYQGFGYCKDSGSFKNIPADGTSIGGVIVFNPSPGLTYTFDGSSIAQLTDPTQWVPTLGTIRFTGGGINSGYLGTILSGTDNPPCCGNAHTQDDERNKSNHNNNRNNTGNAGNDKNASGINLATNSNVAMPNADGLTFNCFPNPASMTLNFSFSAQTNVTIKIMDLTGNVIDEQVISGGNLATFDVHAYAKGIYLYQIVMPNNVATGKVVIE